MSALGLDVGGSAARWCLMASDGAALARGEGPGFSGHIFTDVGRSAAAAGIAAVKAALPPNAVITCIHAGVTGLTAQAPAATSMRDMLAAAFETPGSRVTVEGDGTLAHRAAFAPGAGHLIMAGTGAVGVHVGADETVTIVGGRGVVIDDAGGGYWIAMRGLRAVLRAEDRATGSGWATLLGCAFARLIGGTSWDDVRRAVYGTDRGGVGALAPAVAEAANEGDALAVAILADAGTELARLAIALSARCGERPIALVGRAGTMHPAIRDGLAAALPVGTPIATPTIDPARTAARLALQRVV